MSLTKSNPEKHQADRNPFRKYGLAGWQLAKVPLCTLIGCSAGFGAALAPVSGGIASLQLAGCVTLIAMGGATFNSLQERITDRDFRRTAVRPLVRKAVPIPFAVLQGLACSIFGIALLCILASTPWTPVLLSLAALFCYNAIYTPLKQKTLLAILPGAVCGGIPPLIGWTANGGELFSLMSLQLLALLFLWQVPHFCLILLAYKDDYRGAKQPTFLLYISENGLRRLSSIWICALALVMMLFCFNPVPIAPWHSSVVILNAAFLACMISIRLLSSASIDYRKVFIMINIMLTNHMIILTAGLLVQ